MPRLTRPEQKQYHKSTAIEFDKRVETVRQLALTGIQAKAIIRYGTEKWGIKPRMVERYIERAITLNQGLLKFSEAEMLAEHVAHRRDLRKRAQASGDFRAELATARDEAQLIGLYAAQKIEIHDWREAAKAQGLTDADIETATEQAATLFEKIATGQASPIETEKEGE